MESMKRRLASWMACPGRLSKRSRWAYSAKTFANGCDNIRGVSSSDAQRRRPVLRFLLRGLHERATIRAGEQERSAGQSVQEKGSVPGNRRGPADYRGPSLAYLVTVSYPA